MNNVRNLIILRARNPPSKIQRFKESKISKNVVGGDMFVSYNRIVCDFISRYAWHLFELFAIRHRRARIILPRRACNGTEVSIFSVRTVIFLIS